jgi:hypothetical protein
MRVEEPIEELNWETLQTESGKEREREREKMAAS